MFFLLFCCCNDITVEGEDNSVWVSTRSFSTDKDIVKNGDTISLTTDVKGTHNDVPILFSVKYYCDQNEIGFSNDSASKYHIDYQVKDLSIGKHILKSEAEYISENEGAHGLSKQSKSITVIE